MADHNTSPSSQDDLTFPDWQPQFHAALLETDPKQLPQRVIAAEEAIFTRMQALASALNGDTERHAIEDAMRQLRVIQVEKLNYPDWNKE
jgi:surfactin synthase thioesterase subunit